METQVIKILNEYKIDLNLIDLNQKDSNFISLFNENINEINSNIIIKKME